VALLFRTNEKCREMRKNNQQINVVLWMRNSLEASPVINKSNANNKAGKRFTITYCGA
jgi:hypothetical protein